MSTTKNKCVQCDWCGKISNNRNGEYTKPDGRSAGYIVQPEWVRFPGGDPTALQSTEPHPDDGKDICQECAANCCPACGSPRIVHATPVIAGPSGWGGRCKVCKFTWGMPV